MSHACMHSDPIQDRLLQRHFIRHHPQAAASTEIIGYSPAPFALQTDRHRQTTVQLRCTDNLELSACFCH